MTVDETGVDKTGVNKLDVTLVFNFSTPAREECTFQVLTKT